MLIIPAIDLREGRVVRLLRGEYDKEIVYSDDPVAIAKQWRDQGAQRIHVVDLDGALKGAFTSIPQVEQIVNAVGFPVEFGGGIRCQEDVKSMFDLGVSFVVIGTKACEDEAFLQHLIAKYKDKIIVGVDVKQGKVSTRGWTQTSEYASIEFVQKLERMGVETVICTDISTDGMLSGHNITATKQILDETSTIQLIASGGVATLNDIKNLKQLEHPRLLGVIVGRALYEKRFTLQEAIAC